MGEKLILTDFNHVLSNYEVVTGNAYIDGDKLIVDDVLLGSNEIKLKRKRYDQLSSIYFKAFNSQDFMFLRINDLYSSFNINGFVSYSQVSIYKTGEVLTDYDGKFIYEERVLDDISFREQNSYIIWRNITIFAGIYFIYIICWNIYIAIPIIIT